MITKRITKQEKVLEYLWNYSGREHNVAEIVRNTGLKNFQVHNALRALENRRVIKSTKETSMVNEMPKNLLKIKLMNFEKVRYIINKRWGENAKKT